MDTANTYGLHRRFQMKRPKRGSIRVHWISAAEYAALKETPHFGVSTFWQCYQAGVTRQGGQWLVLLRPFAIAGEYPARILLLPTPARC